MEPKQEIEQLTRELEHAGYLYYVLDNPEMSDYDYDHKLRRLEELEAQYPQYASPLSPTRRVGGQALSRICQGARTPCRWKACRTCFPMTSCGSLTRTCARRSRTRHTASSRRSTVSPSRWNMSTAQFVRGATRGDGLHRRGCDGKSQDHPLHPHARWSDAPARLIVRGEVFMPRASFEALNARAGKARKAALCQPAQRGGGLFAPARPRYRCAAQARHSGLQSAAGRGCGLSGRTRETLDYLHEI